MTIADEGRRSERRSSPAEGAAEELHRSAGELDELAPPTHMRDESPLERLDRNTGELVQELRVAGTGIQVLLAFLLVIPFYNRFPNLSTFDRDLYFFALLCIAIAAVMLIAPSIHHRLLFRQGQKLYLVRMGNRMLVVGSAFLAVGLTAILVLISNVVLGTAAALVVGVLAACVVGGLWFGLPISRRRAIRRDYRRAPRGTGGQ